MELDVGGEARGDGNGGRGLELDFSRGGAPTGSRRVVGGEGRGGSGFGRIGARGTTAGRRTTAGAASDELGFAQSARCARKGNEGTGSFEGARDDKSCARTTRIAGMDDAWSSSPAFKRRYGRRRAQCRALEFLCSLV